MLFLKAQPTYAQQVTHVPPLSALTLKHENASALGTSQTEPPFSEGSLRFWALPLKPPQVFKCAAGDGTLAWHGYQFGTPVQTITRTAGDGQEAFACDGLQARGTVGASQRAVLGDFNADGHPRTMCCVIQPLARQRSGISTTMFTFVARSAQPFQPVGAWSGRELVQ